MIYEDAFQAYNLRSQMHYELRKDMTKGMSGNVTNQSLALELSTIQYETSAEKTIKSLGKMLLKKFRSES